MGLVHEHLGATIEDQLHEDSARLSFFGNRLGRFFERRRDFLAAFGVYVGAGEQRQGDRVVDRAAHQAVGIGGGAPAIPVLRRQAELAKERGAADAQLRAALQLAGALRQTGATVAARAALDDARGIAEAQGDPVSSLWVAEVEAALGLDKRTRTERIGHFEVLRERCLERNDGFSAARTGTLLTAEYIAARDYGRAEVVARDVLSRFKELGDEYGARIARLNLASALSGVEGREEEAAQIAQELDREVVPEKYPRERAVLCNYLARRYRGADELERAAGYALEAIQIGESLKDAHVIALNRTTLGNLKAGRREVGRGSCGIPCSR